MNMTGQIRPIHIAAATAACVLLSTTAQAALQEFEDKAEWVDAVGGDFTTIDFTGFPAGTIITDQYQHLGVDFVSDSQDRISGPINGYPNDLWGLRGFTDVTLAFSSPIQWFAMDFPGDMRVELTLRGEHVANSGWFGMSGAGHFGGVISDQPFDGVRLLDPVANTVDLDDIHFGPPIPAPGALAALALAGLAPRGRRRR